MIKVACSPLYCHPLPKGHRFPMEKYDLLPRQLLHEGTLTSENFFCPNPISAEQAQVAHTREYINKLESLSLTKKEERATGFPLSQRLVEREFHITGGTYACIKHSIDTGISYNIAGGTHHAYSDHGEGFCLLNDIAVSSLLALRENLVERVLVIDLDVHQGNGTAQILRNNKSVFTFSMHGANNYPLRKEKSDLDIELPDNIGDKEYLKILENQLTLLYQEVKPNLIHFQSGVDVVKQDKLGRLGLTIEGCATRDEIVIESAYGRQIPIIATMGGGYSPEIKDIIEAHSNTYRIGMYYYS